MVVSCDRLGGGAQINKGGRFKLTLYSGSFPLLK